MATTPENAGASGPFYVTRRVLSTGTTTTPTMHVWKLLTDHLLNTGKPMSQAELVAKTHLSPEEIETIFRQEYYQKYYGFRRFETMEEYEQWVREEGVLYDPEKHAPAPEEGQAESARAEAPQAEAGGEPQGDSQPQA